MGGASDAVDDAVVSIETTPDAAISELCTGVVVAPRVVLTAGHCAAHQDAATLVVGVGFIANRPTRTVAVASTRVLPSFTGDSAIDGPAGRDLGVILLAEDVGVAPVAIAPAPSVGSVAQLVGFGQSSVTNLDTRGTRRSGAVNIAGVCSTLLEFGDATVNACHGDSGGPLLVDGRLVGIVSWGRTFACDPPSYAVRVDAYSDWIDAIIAGSPDAGCASCDKDASDCTSITTDAGIDASHDAASEASADASPSPAASDASGCALSAHRSNESTFLSALLIVAALLARRTRPPLVSRGKEPV